MNQMMNQQSQNPTVTVSKMPLSQKYIDFINATNVYAEFLEGTTASGKTTIGAGIKFMRMVSASHQRFHAIASKTLGKAELTILKQTNGILDIHKNAQYFRHGNKNHTLPHVEFEDKIIFVLSYGDSRKWEMALGAQFGCVYVDEINIADIEFLREIVMRCDYFLATCNPDDPNLKVYKEFINRSRPYKKYACDVPPSIMEELREPAEYKWRYWFFTFNDNKGLSAETIRKKKAASPPGTKSHKNKILGLRGKADGLVFENFDVKKHCLSRRELVDAIKAGKVKFHRFSAGLDTSYSHKSKDLIAMIFVGITTDGRLYILDELTHNNKDDFTWGPSDIAREYRKFLDKNRKDWGFAREVYYDSADQGYAAEWLKYQHKNATSYAMFGAWKQVEILTRIDLQNEWIAGGYFYVLEHCTAYIDELNSYCWSEKNPGKPEDADDHAINACQYSWIPYKHEIGVNKI